MQTQLLGGKSAIITGANRGIGKAIVREFANCGASVWACIRRQDDLIENEIKEWFSDHAFIKFLYFDMTDDDAMFEAVKQIRADKKQIDVLVNNAGVSYDALLPMVDIGRVGEMFDVNFFAQAKFTQFVSRLMSVKKKGSIINITSYLAEHGNKGQSMYAASKAAMNAFTVSLAKELASSNIRVNAVAPGVVNTDLIQTMNEAEYEEAIHRCLLKRAAEPLEIASTVAFIASDKASYINGQIIRVDGGI